MEISSPVEPGFVVLCSHVNDQRVAIPTADGPAHPRIGRGLGLTIHIDNARRTGKLVGDQDLFGSFNDLKRQPDIRGSRNPWKIALGFGIAHSVVHLVRSGTDKPFFEIFFFLGGGPRLVRNPSTFYDALSRGLSADSAQKFRER